MIVVSPALPMILQYTCFAPVATPGLAGHTESLARGGKLTGGTTELPFSIQLRSANVKASKDSFTHCSID